MSCSKSGKSSEYIQKIAPSIRNPIRSAALSELKIEPKKDRNIRKIKLKSPVGNKRVDTLIKDHVSKKILN